jgi:hypothetical protein
MPQGLRGWAVWIAAQAALTYALKLLIKLGENAVMGWGDDQIAAFLGIKSPTLTTLVNWGPPAMAAAGVLMAYHFMVYNRHHPSPPRFQDRAKEIDLTEALWFPKNPLGDAGKKPNMQVAWRRYPRASDYENRPT